MSRVPLGMLWLLDPDDTRYSPGYDDRVFRSVKPGTRAAEAEQLLGEPLSKLSLGHGRSGWYDSAPGLSQDYLVRALVLSADDRVIARESDCYLD